MVRANNGCKFTSFRGEPIPLIDVCCFSARIGISISLVNFFFKVDLLYVKESVDPLISGLRVRKGDSPASLLLLA